MSDDLLAQMTDALRDEHDGATAVPEATRGRVIRQLSERKHQRPWDLGKDVEGSAVFSPIAKASDWSIGEQRIWLTQNGETKQDSTLDLMVWKVPEIIAHLSGFYHLGPGDLIMTGTPEGVGPVRPGDRLEGGVDGLEGISLDIREPD